MPLGIANLAIFVIIVAALVAIVVVAVRAMGVRVPEWVAQIGWILLVALAALLAIKLLLFWV